MKKAIYKITNLINGKVYIGQSVHPNRRWIEHKQYAMNGIDDYPIHQAIRKYGKENFTFEILEEVEDYNEEEKRLIKVYNSLVPNGYNICPGGESHAMYGEDNPRNTVKNSDVPLIIQDLKDNKMSDREIAKKYYLTDKIIADINHGYTHRLDGESYPIRVKKGKQKLTLKEVSEIKDLLSNSGISYQEIANIYKVSKGTIYHINKGLTFKEDRAYPIRRI